MVDLAVITALIYSGSLGKNFVKFKEKKFKMLFTSLGRSVLGTSGTAFPNKDLPAGE